VKRQRKEQRQGREQRQNSRRDFLKTSALTAAGLWAGGTWSGQWTGRRVWGSATQPATEKLSLAVIGVSNQGLWNLEQLATTNQAIVALCDVDNRNTGKAREMFPKAEFFVDYRQMIDKLHKQIDAVLVATPDHSHAHATMAALRADKHVYCEKPLTHTVWEAQQIMAAARKHKRITQMGTQIHAGNNYRRVVEIVQAGVIGKVHTVHVWAPLFDVHWSGEARPKESQPVPEGVNWDLWIGPAPMRPYHEVYMPQRWRGWWDFGGGGHADMACHYLDLAYWALGLGHPKTIEAEGPPVHEESTPKQLRVRYQHAARGDQPAVKVTWGIGHKHPDDYDKDKMPDWGAGVLFIGEKGMLASDYNRHQLYPEADFADFKPLKPTIPDSIGHHAEWIKAIKEGGQTTCNFGYSGVLTQAVLLGNVAYRSGRKLEWDPERMKLPNAPEAEKFLRREYRKGWELV